MSGTAVTLPKYIHIRENTLDGAVFKIPKPDTGAIDGCFPHPKTRIFPKIISKNQLTPKYMWPKLNIKVSPTGTNASFVVKDTTVSFDQKTGSITLTNQAGDKETYKSKDDLPFKLKSKFSNGKPVKIDIDDNGTFLTLYPAADRKHIANAVVTWAEPRENDKGRLIFRTPIENTVTIDNVTRPLNTYTSGNISISQEQNFVHNDRMVPFSSKLDRLSVNSIKY